MVLYYILVPWSILIFDPSFWSSDHKEYLWLTIRRMMVLRASISSGINKVFFLFVCLLHQRKSDLDHWRESFSTGKEGYMSWKSNSVI